MSLIIEALAKLPDLSNQPATNLTADVLAAAVALTVKSTVGFAANDFVIVGYPGAEGAEIVQVSGVTDGVTLAVSALVIGHSQLASVIKLPYNKVKVYSSATEGGTYAEISGSPFTLLADQLYTPITDPAGTTATWYKASWYNSQSAVETAKGAAQVGNASTVLFTLEELKQDLKINPTDRSKDNMLAGLIAKVTAKIIKDTKRQYISKTVTDEYRDIDGNQTKLFPYYGPIYGTPTVVDNGQSLTWNVNPDVTDFYIYDTYIERNFTPFFPGQKRVKISYVAYEPCPEDLKMAAIAYAAVVSGLKMKTFDDGSGIAQAVTMTAIPKWVMEIINSYRRVTF